MLLKRKNSAAPMLVVMTGIPGSGKSTAATTLQVENARNLQTFSSDALREELYGAAAIQGDNKALFAMLRQRVRKHLEDGKDAIYDATNISGWQRENALELIRGLNVEAVSVFVDTPLEECLRRNASRDRKVPEKVIRRMHSQLTRPSIGEGFDQIIVL